MCGDAGTCGVCGVAGGCACGAGFWQCSVDGGGDGGAAGAGAGCPPTPRQRHAPVGATAGGVFGAAGVATGGIAHGALAAQELNLPFAYVRAEAKKHGLQNLIEGVIEKGRTVVLIEDLISTGGSSIKAVNAVIENGNNVKGVVSIMDYGFEKAKENFNGICDFYSLCDFDILIETAVNKEFITQEDYQDLLKWKANM